MSAPPAGPEGPADAPAAATSSQGTSPAGTPVAGGAGAGYDWTKVYSAWERFEDADEVAAKAKAEEARAAAAAARPFYFPNRDRSKERTVYEMSNPAKFAAVARFRSRGNLFFREGQFERALIQYRAVLLYYEYTFPDDPEGEDSAGASGADAAAEGGGDEGRSRRYTQAALDRVRLHCLNNAAACALHLRRWDEAESFASQALEADRTNVKAFFRRAVARRRRHRLVEAETDLHAALALQPSSVALLRERALLQRAVRAYEAKSRAISRAMIGGLGGGGAGGAGASGGGGEGEARRSGRRRGAERELEKDTDVGRLVSGVTEGGGHDQGASGEGEEEEEEEAEEEDDRVSWAGSTSSAGRGEDDGLDGESIDGDELEGVGDEERRRGAMTALLRG